VEGERAVDLSLIYRIAGVGILIAILNIFLQQADRKEQAHMLSLAGVVIVLLWLVQLIAQLFAQVESVFRWY
jgi:stage III sporulation protein AC